MDYSSPFFSYLKMSTNLLSQSNKSYLQVFYILLRSLRNVCIVTISPYPAISSLKLKKNINSNFEIIQQKKTLTNYPTEIIELAGFKH